MNYDKDLWEAVVDRLNDMQVPNMAHTAPMVADLMDQTHALYVHDTKEAIVIIRVPKGRLPQNLPWYV